MILEPPKIKSDTVSTVSPFISKLESRLPGEISINSGMQMTPPLLQKVKRNQKPLDESEEDSEKLA